MTILEVLGKAADKKKQSRNQIIVTLLDKATTPKVKKS